MKAKAQLELSRRERQIMEAVYRLGSATVSDVMAEMPDRPATSFVQFSSSPVPRGVTRPMPVTTTRRRVPLVPLKPADARGRSEGCQGCTTR